MEHNLQNLYYPLNVYAVLMHRATGCVPYLSYGLHDEVGTADVSAGSGTHINHNWLQSQQKVADIIARQISGQAPLRILDVGCGPATLAVQLARAGHSVCGIDNNAAALQLARTALTQQPELSIEIVQAEFLDWASDCAAANYDVLIFQNSARYFLPLDLFSAVRRLLRPGGQVLVFDEFCAGHRTVHQPDPLPVLTYVQALAERVGFQQTLDLDLSPGVVSFQLRWLHWFDQNLSDLASLSGLTQPAITALRQQLADDTDKSQQGFYTHRLLSWIHQADNNAPWLCNALRLPAESFRDVFEQSFQTAFSAELWHWKYAAPRGASVAITRQTETGTQLVAHYGGVVRDILYFGVPDSAAQICDVMVLPGERSFFSRQGHFFKTAASMLEQYVGYTAPHLLGIGFPNLKAMHVAQRLKLYEKTDELVQLRLPESAADDGFAVSSDDADVDGTTRQKDASEGRFTQDATNNLCASALSVAPAELSNLHTDGLDQLWQQMCSGFTDAIIGLRDRDYLQYRYLQRPGMSYPMWQVMDHSTLVGIVFVRRHGDHLLMMDIVAAVPHLSAVWQAADRFARAQGQLLLFWLTAGQVPRLAPLQPIVEPLGIQIPCNRWSDGPATDTLAGAWWLTAGDMDFM